MKKKQKTISEEYQTTIKIIVSKQQKTHLMLEKNLMLDRLEISSFEMRNFV